MEGTRGKQAGEGTSVEKGSLSKSSSVLPVPLPPPPPPPELVDVVDGVVWRATTRRGSRRECILCVATECAGRGEEDGQGRQAGNGVVEADGFQTGTETVVRRPAGWTRETRAFGCGLEAGRGTLSGDNRPDAIAEAGRNERKADKRPGPESANAIKRSERVQEASSECKTEVGKAETNGDVEAKERDQGPGPSAQE